MEPSTILGLAIQVMPPRHIGAGAARASRPIIIASGDRVADFAAAVVESANRCSERQDNHRRCQPDPDVSIVTSTEAVRPKDGREELTLFRDCGEDQPFGVPLYRQQK
jgi:hypothetical protein